MKKDNLIVLYDTSSRAWYYLTIDENGNCKFIEKRENRGLKKEIKNEKQ